MKYILLFMLFSTQLFAEGKEEDKELTYRRYFTVGYMEMQSTLNPSAVPKLKENYIRFVKRVFYGESPRYYNQVKSQIEAKGKELRWLGCYNGMATLLSYTSLKSWPKSKIELIKKNMKTTCDKYQERDYNSILGTDLPKNKK